jgi:hypothetical protein
MRKIMIVLTAVLPILMVMAGCIDNGQQQTAQQPMPMQQVFFVWDPCSNSWVPTSPNPAFVQQQQQQIPIVEQRIYVQQENDPIYDSFMLQQMQRQNTQDTIRQLNKTNESLDESVRKMRQTQGEGLGMLQGLWMQQQVTNNNAGNMQRSH